MDTLVFDNEDDLGRAVGVETQALAQRTHDAEPGPLENVLRTLDDLVSEGKILYPAASNFAASFRFSSGEIASLYSL